MRKNDDAFGNKKFQKQNLGRIDEAVRDIYMAYGLAAVQLQYIKHNQADMHLGYE